MEVEHEEWQGLNHLGYEVPTEAVIEKIVQCAARLGATDVVVVGNGEAVRRALDQRLPVSGAVTVGSLVVAVWEHARALSALSARPRGVLTLGPRPGTVKGHSTEHVSAYYQTAEKAGYVSVAKWGVPSRCYLDIKDDALRARASGLLGAEAFFSAQELFAPVEAGMVAEDDALWHRFCDKGDELEMFSWTDRIQRDGLRAIVPDGFNRLQALLKRLIAKQRDGIELLYAALARSPEVARGFAVWHGINAMGYRALDGEMLRTLDGMFHSRAGHPSARSVAAGNLLMYFDSRDRAWPAVCSGCLARAPAKLCACRKARYCGLDCQRAHWRYHRATCDNKD